MNKETPRFNTRVSDHDDLLPAASLFLPRTHELHAVNCSNHQAFCKSEQQWKGPRRFSTERTPGTQNTKGTPWSTRCFNSSIWTTSNFAFAFSCPDCVDLYRISPKPPSMAEGNQTTRDKLLFSYLPGQEISSASTKPLFCVNNGALTQNTFNTPTAVLTTPTGLSWLNKIKINPEPEVKLHYKPSRIHLYAKIRFKYDLRTDV